jgi:hypothetical protein
MVSRVPEPKQGNCVFGIWRLHFEDSHNIDTDQAMKHRTVDYDVEEVQPGRWRWINRGAGLAVFIPAVIPGNARTV